MDKISCTNYGQTKNNSNAMDEILRFDGSYEYNPVSVNLYIP
jgi:hypothetical protein